MIPKCSKLLLSACITFCGLAGCQSLDTSAPPPSSAAGETEQSAEARSALADLQSKTPAAASLGRDAKAVLVFPQVVKGGFIIGGQGGAGVLFKQGQIAGYYDTVGASYGLQAGIQKYGYALYFMSDEALRYIDSTEGWEIGVGPSVVVVDQGMATSLTTTTANSGIYAFFFDQKGLMAGLGLQGSKIVRAKR